jgi:hypothetical protein
MPRKRSPVVVLLLGSVAALALSAGGCGLFRPGLAGTYTGNINFTGTITPVVPGGQPFTFSFSNASTLIIKSNNYPQDLKLPILFDNGTSGRQIGLDIFTVGETKTYSMVSNLTINGAVIEFEVTLTATVREAEVTSRTFRYVYDYTATVRFNSGLIGGTTLTSTGTATFEGSLSGAVLTYSVVIDQETSSMTGSVTTNVLVDAVGSGSLIRW